MDQLFGVHYFHCNWPNRVVQLSGKQWKCGKVCIRNHRLLVAPTKMHKITFQSNLHPRVFHSEPNLHYSLKHSLSLCTKVAAHKSIKPKAGAGRLEKSPCQCPHIPTPLLNQVIHRAYSHSTDAVSQDCLVVNNTYIFSLLLFFPLK